MKSSSLLRKTLIASVCFTVLAISGCQLTENTLKADRSANQEVQDYRDMLAPREAPMDDKNKTSSIPELQPYVADNSQSMKAMPLVSVAINQSIPLRDALFELAKQADYDVQLDPRIKGSVIYTARNKPFDLVVSQISEIAGLRYKFENDTLKVELDTPYTKNYKVEYLALTRDSKSSIDTSTKVESGSGTVSGGPATGSSFGISSESKIDFWGELDTNVKQILQANSQLNYMITANDPEISMSAAAPPPVPPVDERLLNDTTTSVQPGIQPSVQPTAQPAVQPSSAIQPSVQTVPGEQHSEITSNYSAGQLVPQVPVGSNMVPSGSSAMEAQKAAAANPTIPASAVPVNGAPATATPQQVQLNVNSLPTTTTATSPDGTTYTPSYSVNRQAGLVSVYATQKAHDQIGAYLDLIRKAATAQVLIEAKVLEVELNDEFSYGINWDVLTNDDTFGASLNVARGTFGANGELANFVINSGSNGLEPLVNAIQRFGTIHALASPRLTVLNNQSAVLNVAENQVYFEINADREQNATTGDTTLSVDSTIKNVPQGVLINVLPAIDVDRGVVSMQVRPTISRITGYVSDPAVALTLASVGQTGTGITSDIPIVSTKEVDSVVNMKSGQTLVMGGLLEDRTDGTQRAVPLLGEVPVIGAAFRGQEDGVHKSEIVLLLKATIINNASETISDADRDLYRVYSQDRRPFKL